MKKGYYKVKFYNHVDEKLMFWNGSQFEGFKSDQMPNDEIESSDSLSHIFGDVQGQLDGLTITP